MVVSLLVGFFTACDCQVFIVAGLVSHNFSGPPNWLGGFRERVLCRTLVASLMMFSLVVHRETAVFLLGLVDESSSLPEFQVSVCAMVVGGFLVAAVVGCHHLVFSCKSLVSCFFVAVGLVLEGT